MTSESSLIVNQQQDISIVSFAKPTLLDTFHITKVGDELMKLAGSGANKIVLDLASIKMISSQALGVLLSVRQKLNQTDGKVVVAGIDPRLYRVFKITNLQTVFEFYEDVETAVKSFDQC